MTVKRKHRFSAVQIITMGFLCLILFGTALLCLPAASVEGRATPFITSLFTATSATCVTGLITVDTGTYWSLFGQIVIICMIQIGGLGFMTMAVTLSLIVKRAVTPREKMIVAQALSLNDYEDTASLVKRIIGGTFIFEGVGALVLATQFVPLFGWGRGMYTSVFLSISAFCNAGFDVLGDRYGEFTNLIGVQENAVICITIMSLIIIGGIGFIVWRELRDKIKRKKRLSVYTRFVLIITAVLIFGGALLIALFEWNNPDTLGGMDTGTKILSSFFQSVTTRTAGFMTVDNAAMTDASKLLSVLLMFVGGAAGSTAGGVKVATVGIVIFATITIMRGKTDVILFRRRISQTTVMRANAVFLLNAALILTGALILCYTDSGINILDAIYETVSASSTVGLSLGLTTMLGAAAQALLVLVMFFGRVGILTVSYAIMMKIARYEECIGYPETPMLL